MPHREIEKIVHEVIDSEAINMKIAQMVKCSVGEQIRSIGIYTVPLIAIIGYLVIDEYKELKSSTTSHTATFTREIGSLREAIVELRTTIKKGI